MITPNPRRRQNRRAFDDASDNKLTVPSHVLTVYEGEYFKPQRSILIMNEGIIRSGQHVAGAFEATLADPRLITMVKDGAKPILLNRLASMAQVKAAQGGFYAELASGALDPVEEFMLEDWLADYEAKRQKVGVTTWLP